MIGGGGGRDGSGLTDGGGSGGDSVQLVTVLSLTMLSVPDKVGLSKVQISPPLLKTLFPLTSAELT